MTVDQLLWQISRTAALAAFFVLCFSIITGEALRTSLVRPALRNRELLSLHAFVTVCWLPLLALHIIAITLDSVARLSPLDLLLPFRVSYAPLAIGLGTLSFDLLLIVLATSYLRQHLDPMGWRWLHRLSYLMFGLLTAHALLAGTDFSRTVVLAPAAAVVAFITVLTFARIAIGRLDIGRS